jgi:hypothetical protein
MTSLDTTFLMPGYLTSIRLTESGLSLLVTLKNKFINARTCADKYEELRKTYENGALRDHVFEFFKGKSIMTTYGNHKVYKIDDIAMDLNVTNHKITYTGSNNETVEMTLEEYYSKTYNLNINPRRRDFPLLISRREKAGNTQEALLIMEFCFMTGLEDEMRQDESMTKNMTNKTKLTPADRMTKIKEIKNLLYKRGNQPRVKTTKRGTITLPWPDEVRESWGLEVTEFTTLKGRQLDPPNIQFADSKIKV